MVRPLGWRNDNYRHSLAARGISTRRSFANLPMVNRKKPDYKFKLYSPSGEEVYTEKEQTMPYAWDEATFNERMAELGVTDPAEIAELKQAAIENLLEAEQEMHGREIRPKGGKTIPEIEATMWEEYKDLPYDEKLEFLARNGLSQDLIKRPDHEQREAINALFYKKAELEEEKILARAGSLLEGQPIKEYAMVEGEEGPEVESRTVTYVGEGLIPAVPYAGETKLKMQADAAQRELDAIRLRAIKRGFTVEDSRELSELAKLLAPGALNKMRAADDKRSVVLMEKQVEVELGRLLAENKITRDFYNNRMALLKEEVNTRVAKDDKMIRMAAEDEAVWKEQFRQDVKAYSSGGLQQMESRIYGLISAVKPGTSDPYGAYNRARSQIRSLAPLVGQDKAMMMARKLEAEKSVVDLSVAQMQQAEKAAMNAERAARMRSGIRQPKEKDLDKLMEKMTPEQRAATKERISQVLRKMGLLRRR